MKREQSYFVGLDLGQAQEFTALAVLEQWRPDWAPYADRPPRRYDLGLVERFPLGTPYKEIIARVRDLVTTSPKGEVIPLLQYAKIAVDQTGVGRPVVAMLQEAGLPNRICPILITNGQTNSGAGGVYHVPKTELVSTLQVLLQGRRLAIAALPERALLIKEFMAFKAKVTVAGKETLDDWRERDHDDLVLAIALAAWLAEREPDYVDDGGPSAVGRRAW